MRKLLVYALCCSVLGCAALVAQNPKAPEKLTFPAKTGPVMFDHAAHAKREKNDCKVCHPALFAQDVKAPLKFKPPHKTEETNKTSCGSCHRAGGSAFATTGNCTNSKCHVKAAAKKG